MSVDNKKYLSNFNNYLDGTVTGIETDKGRFCLFVPYTEASDKSIVLYDCFCKTKFVSMSGLIAHKLACKKIKERYAYSSECYFRDLTPNEGHELVELKRLVKDLEFENRNLKKKLNDSVSKIKPTNKTDQKVPDDIDLLKQENDRLKQELQQCRTVNLSNSISHNNEVEVLKRALTEKEEQIHRYEELQQSKTVDSNNSFSNSCETEILKRALAEKEEQIRRYEELLRFTIVNGKSITTINNNLVINNILQERGKDYFEGCKKLIDKYTDITEINSSNLSPFKRMIQEIRTINSDDAKVVSSILDPPTTLEDEFYEQLQRYEREKLEEVKKQSDLVGDKNTSTKITELLNSE